MIMYTGLETVWEVSQLISEYCHGICLGEQGETVTVVAGPISGSEVQTTLKNKSDAVKSSQHGQ
jgi:hypothetical protein